MQVHPVETRVELLNSATFVTPFPEVKVRHFLLATRYGWQ